MCLYVRFTTVCLFVSHDVPLQERASSSNWQTAFNAINVLCGVGLLTTPYAMAITGTSALLLLVFVGGFAQSWLLCVLCCFPPAIAWRCPLWSSVPC